MTKRRQLWRGKVPFHPRTGNLMPYPQPVREWVKDRKPGEPTVVEIPLDWRDWYTFDDILILSDKINSGQSAKRCVLVSKTNSVEYPLFVRDLLTICFEHGVKRGGEIAATWGFVKRGQNYGVSVFDKEDWE